MIKLTLGLCTGLPLLLPTGYDNNMLWPGAIAFFIGRALTLARYIVAALRGCVYVSHTQHTSGWGIHIPVDAFEGKRG